MEDYKIYGTCPVCGYELCFEESEICSEENEDEASAEFRLLKAHYAATPACAWVDCDKEICVCKTCQSYSWCENDWKEEEEDC